MTILSKFTKNYIYRHTKKPTHYVHVDKPKTLQEHRQVQFNNWCKVKGVYCGSYLPAKPDNLTAAGKKGWVETTTQKDKTGEHREFKRKSTGKWVSFHDKKVEHGIPIDQHYHWHRYLTTEENRKNKKDKPNFCYYDKYGKICAKDSCESHLAPLDGKYNYREVKKHGKKEIDPNGSSYRKNK